MVVGRRQFKFVLHRAGGSIKRTKLYSPGLGLRSAFPYWGLPCHAGGPRHAKEMACRALPCRKEEVGIK